MLIDRDLANNYQVEVKQMNRQVKRNIDRFPEDFMFQLTKTEYDSLKCHFGTSNKRGGDRRALPYAFTQQGVGMLSGLLRSEIAVETNIKIMRAFDSRGDRHLGYSSRHTQVPVPATIPFSVLSGLFRGTFCNFATRNSSNN